MQNALVVWQQDSHHHFFLPCMHMLFSHPEDSLSSLSSTPFESGLTLATCMKEVILWDFFYKKESVQLHSGIPTLWEDPSYQHGENITNSNCSSHASPGANVGVRSLQTFRQIHLQQSANKGMSAPKREPPSCKLSTLRSMWNDNSWF